MTLLYLVSSERHFMKITPNQSSRWEETLLSSPSADETRHFEAVSFIFTSELIVSEQRTAWSWKWSLVRTQGKYIVEFDYWQEMLTKPVRIVLNGVVPLIPSNWAVIVSRGTQPSQILNQLLQSCREERSLRQAIYMQIHNLSCFSIMKCLKLFRMAKNKARQNDTLQRRLISE